MFPAPLRRVSGNIYGVIFNLPICSSVSFHLLTPSFSCPIESSGHPVNKFVPDDVPIEKLALLGAATDWLDGLNKELDPWVNH